MKRIIAGTAAALLAAVLFLPQTVQAVSAEKAIVMDAVSGRVLFERNADKQSLIASTTKIMTALIICEQCNVLDRMRIPKDAVGIEGSSMYLKEGEVLTIQELLYGLMLSSGNDAAVALAIYCGGTVEEFAERMNDKARILGLQDTHFENPNGLDSPGHYSTARDLAVLAAYAMENPIFYKTVSAKTISVGERHLRNHNKLLWQVEGADGVKTGFTKAAGRILVSSATRNGRRIIAVTLNDANDWQDHAKLLEEGFARYNVQRIVTKNDLIAKVDVAGGQTQQVEIRAVEHFSYAIAPEETKTLVYPGPGFVYAPVAEGADAGVAYVQIAGKTVGKIPVVYGQTIEMEVTEARSLLERIFGGNGYAGTATEDPLRTGHCLPSESGRNDRSRTGQREWTGCAVG